MTVEPLESVRISCISLNGDGTYTVRLAGAVDKEFVFHIKTLDGARIVQAPDDFFRLVSGWNRPFGATLAAVRAIDRAQAELATLTKT